MPDADELACELGTALRARGDLDRAKEVFTRAKDASVERVRLRARIELAYLRSIVEPDGAAELLDIASMAIPVLEAEHDDRGLGRAWLGIAHVKGGFYCQHAAMEEAAARAATHYQRSGWSASSSLDALGFALYQGPRPVEDALALCEELLREHRGDRASEANVLQWMGGLDAMRGRFEEARASVASAKEIYEELGLTAAATEMCGRALGAIEMLAGRPEEAEQALRQSCESLQLRQHTAVLASRSGDLADAIYEQGRYEEAQGWTQTARDLAGDDDLDAALSWKPVHAKILARQGAIEEAEHLAEEALELVGPTDALNRHADSLLALAEVLRLAGREDEALDRVGAAIHLYEQKQNIVSAEHARALLSEKTRAS
jgi:tetratricopeptide (TPR) repeat protein